MRPSHVTFVFTKIAKIMPKKTAKQAPTKLENIQAGPITIDKSGGINIKINAKPGAKNNNITGNC